MLESWRRQRAAKKVERKERSERDWEDRRRIVALHKKRGLYSFGPATCNGLTPFREKPDFDERWVLRDDIEVTPGERSAQIHKIGLPARWSDFGSILLMPDAAVFVGDEVRLKRSNGPSMFVTSLQRVERRTVSVHYEGPCGETRRGTCAIKEHVVASLERVAPTSLPVWIWLDDIDSFDRLKSISQSEVAGHLQNGRVDVLEDIVQRCFENALGETFHKEDWAGEENDLYSTQVLLKGRRVRTAFLLKGRGCKSAELTHACCGKNGDQLERLIQSPADLFVVQFVGRIGEDVIKDLHVKVQHMRAYGRPNASYCTVDGTDTARFLRAYGKL